MKKLKIEDFAYVKSKIMPLANSGDPWRTQVNATAANTTATASTSRVVGNTVSVFLTDLTVLLG